MFTDPPGLGRRKEGSKNAGADRPVSIHSLSALLYHKFIIFSSFLKQNVVLERSSDYFCFITAYALDVLA
jgi:hypothetical protein